MGRWRGRGSGKWSNSAKKLTSAKKKSKPAWSGNSFGTSSWGMGSSLRCASWDWGNDSDSDGDSYLPDAANLLTGVGGSQPTYGSTDVYIGSLRGDIVGIRYYSGTVSKDEMVSLQREPSNAYDSNAVKVNNTIGRQVGHIKRDLAKALSPILDKNLARVEGTIPYGGSNKFSIPVDLNFYSVLSDKNQCVALLKRQAFYLREDPNFSTTSSSNSGNGGTSASTSFSSTPNPRRTYIGQDQMTNELDKIFDTLKEGDKISEVNAVSAIKTTLFVHQKQALHWMISRENSSLQLPPFWKQLASGRYYNTITNFSTADRPKSICGGILADDMGLGKTLELISLILTNAEGGKALAVPVPGQVRSSHLAQKLRREEYRKNFRSQFDDVDDVTCEMIRRQQKEINLVNDKHTPPDAPSTSTAPITSRKSLMTMNIPSTSTDNCDEGDSCWSKDIPEVTKTALDSPKYTKKPISSGSPLFSSITSKILNASKNVENIEDDVGTGSCSFTVQEDKVTISSKQTTTKLNTAPLASERLKNVKIFKTQPNTKVSNGSTTPYNVHSVKSVHIRTDNTPVLYKVSKSSSSSSSCSNTRYEVKTSKSTSVSGQAASVARNQPTADEINDALDECRVTLKSFKQTSSCKEFKISSLVNSSAQLTPMSDLNLSIPASHPREQGLKLKIAVVDGSISVDIMPDVPSSDEKFKGPKMSFSDYVFSRGNSPVSEDDCFINGIEESMAIEINDDSNDGHVFGVAKGSDIKDVPDIKVEPDVKVEPAVKVETGMENEENTKPFSPSACIAPMKEPVIWTIGMPSSIPPNIAEPKIETAESVPSKSATTLPSSSNANSTTEAYPTVVTKKVLTEVDSNSLVPIPSTSRPRRAHKRPARYDEDSDDAEEVKQSTVNDSDDDYIQPKKQKLSDDEFDENEDESCESQEPEPEPEYVEPVRGRGRGRGRGGRARGRGRGARGRGRQKVHSSAKGIAFRYSETSNPERPLYAEPPTNGGSSNSSTGNLCTNTTQLQPVFPVSSGLTLSNTPMVATTSSNLTTMNVPLFVPTPIVMHEESVGLTSQTSSNKEQASKVHVVEPESSVKVEPTPVNIPAESAVTFSDDDDEFDLPDLEQCIPGLDTDDKVDIQDDIPYDSRNPTRLDPRGRAVIHGSRATLVICPLSVMAGWLDQLEMHVDERVDLEVCMYYGPSRTKDASVLANCDIVLTTYQTLSHEFAKPRGAKPLEKVNWLRLVLDEGHTIRNPRAQQTLAVMALKAERKWVLTGTPIQNSMKDLWSIVNFLGIEPFTDRQWWTRTIERPLMNGDEKALKKVQTLIANISMRRMKKQKVNGKPLVDLPDKTVCIEHVKLTVDERVVYENMQKHGKFVVSKYFRLGTLLHHYGEVLAILMRLRQICCHPGLIAKAAKAAQTLAEQAIEDTPGKTDEDALKKSLIEKIMEVLSSGSDEECSICLESLREPVITHCAHLYCKPCIKSVIEQEKAAAKCPLCRGDISIDKIVDAPTMSDMDDDDEELNGEEWQPSAKVDALMQSLILQRKEDHTIKSLVVSQFTSYLKLIEVPLRRHGFIYVKLDGSMSSAARVAAIETFTDNHPDSPTIFLLSLKAGGVGLNLTAASRVYLMDPAWNPATEDQCFDRCHRLGQTREVKVTKFIVEDSVEERMLELQEKKRTLMSGIFGGKKQTAEQKRADRIKDIKILMNI